MTIKFKNPPITELVISTLFNPPIHGLRNEHIGLFWHTVRDQFPVISQQNPVGELDIAMGSEVFPMPRYWMITADEINLIQIQKNAFRFNWRSRGEDYPRYSNLKPVFDKYYDKFHAFVLSEIDPKDLQIEVCELAYINTIESCEYWSGPGDTNNVIPTFSVPDIGIKSKEDSAHSCAFDYVLDDDLQLRVSVRNGNSTKDSEIPVLVIEIRATGRIGSANKVAADNWFDRSHQAIIDCFVGMTNPEIQEKLWLREDTSA